MLCPVTVLWWPRRDHRIRSFSLRRMVFYLAPINIASWLLGLVNTCRQQPNRRNFLSFQSLLLVPRLFQPFVSCPVCSKPNYFDFHYCQRCGYQRQTKPLQTLKSLKAPIDLCSIRERKKTLVARRQATPFKSVLKMGFSQFLESISKKNFCSAIPDDVIDFLIWKDNFGKTVVHDTCPLFCEKSVSFLCLP